MIGDPEPPCTYNCGPEYDGRIDMKAVAVPMRDGGDLSVELDRPNAAGKFPALLGFICSARTIVHTIYRDTARPSHLLLPIIDRSHLDP